MIDATEFIAAATPANGSDSGHKIAQVVGFFDSGAAQIQFAGESAPAAKEYPYLRSYKPQEGDYVLMFALADSYIILGAINFQIPPEDVTKAVTDELETLKTDVSKGKTEFDKHITAFDELKTNFENNHYVNSNMDVENADNFNVDYIYVDPTTGYLYAHRKNGVWTKYASIK